MGGEHGYICKEKREWGRGGGAAPGGGTAPLRRAGRVCAAEPGGDGALPEHPGGRPHCGRRPAQAGAAGGRGQGVLPGDRRPGGAGLVPPACEHRARTEGYPVLPGRLSGLHAHLRPGGGRDRPRPAGPGDRGGAVRQPGGRGDSGGGVAAGVYPVGKEWGRAAPGAAPAGAAALHPLSAGGGQPLRRESAAVHALPDRNPAEHLPGDGDELGADGQRALRGGLQAGGRAPGAVHGPGAQPPDRPGVVRSHGGGAGRPGARFCRRGRRGHQGDRSGQPGAGQRGAGAADSGTARGPDGHTALPVGIELVVHRADEHPAGRHDDQRAHRHPAGAGACGGAYLRAVAGPPRVRPEGDGGLGGHQPPGSGRGGPGGTVP